MWRADSFEKTLMLGKIKGGRRRGWDDEMVGWHHQLNGHESEWTLGVGDGQGGLACCGSWSRKGSDTTEWLNWTNLNWTESPYCSLYCLFPSKSVVFAHLGPSLSCMLHLMIQGNWVSLLCVSLTTSHQSPFLKVFWGEGRHGREPYNCRWLLFRAWCKFIYLLLLGWDIFIFPSSFLSVQNYLILFHASLRENYPLCHFSTLFRSLGNE